MNIYDFDKTIFDGDSTLKFVLWCIKKYPKTILTLPLTAWSFFLYITGLYSKTKFKENMYRFLKYVPDVDNEINLFWNAHIKEIKKWYLDMQKADDYVISASPDFLVRPVCERLGIKRLIASEVDKSTGKYTGENCWGEEKVKRLIEKEGNIKINEFYSDSLSDAPLAEMAEKAYIISGNKKTNWSDYKPPKYAMFLSREFLAFLIIGVLNTFTGSLFAVLYRSFIPNDTVAFIPGWISGNIVSYFLNSTFTFKDTNFRISKYLKFLVSNLPNLVIQSVIVQLFSVLFHLPSIIVYGTAAVIGVPVTFIFVKLFAFAKKG